MGAPPVYDLDLKAAAIVSYETSQLLKGVGLRVLNLAEQVSCQLVGVHTPQVPMDPPAFMFAPLSMSETKYQLAIEVTNKGLS